MGSRSLYRGEIVQDDIPLTLLAEGAAAYLIKLKRSPSNTHRSFN